MPLLIWEVATAYLVEVPLLIWEVATAYLFLLHNHATLWSNLQDCKISSRVEISKLGTSVAIIIIIIMIIGLFSK